MVPVALAFLYTLLLASVQAQGKVALAIASSGIAALLMENRRTAHSRFKMVVPANETSTCRWIVLLSSLRIQMIRSAKFCMEAKPVQDLEIGSSCMSVPVH